MVPEAEQPGRLSCKRGSACWTSSPRWSGEPKNDMQGPWAHWPKPPKIQLIWSYFVVAYRVVSYSGYVLGTGRESWPLILTYKLLVEVPSLATYRMILGTLWVIYIYTGWWFQALWQIWVRQLGWWHSPNHQPDKYLYCSGHVFLQKTCSYAIIHHWNVRA